MDKPVLNVFRMFGMMKGKRVAVSGNQMYDLKTMVDSSVRRTYNDVGGLAAKDKKSATVMIWNYHDDDIMNLLYLLQLPLMEYRQNQQQLRNTLLMISIVILMKCGSKWDHHRN